MKSIRIFLQSFFLLVGFSLISANGQSSNVDSPTPVTTNSIIGKIKARDIGDPRSTVHYYVFEGSQGDIFLNIESNNLNGDIDIFYADNLRPLTKISLYADSAPTQTGREIYLRKPERLILRVEGRTPTDESATYAIKFEGSFVALTPAKLVNQPKLPEVNPDSEGEVKVNSVGTIIETKPKAAPTPRETVGRNSGRRGTRTVTTPQPVSTIKSKSTGSKKVEPKVEETEEPNKKVEAIVTDNLPSKEPEKGEISEKIEPKAKTTKKNPASTKRTTAKKETPAKTPRENPTTELAKALENVRLVVEFKDGAKIERSLNEVVRFGVDKGVLTIVNKNGSIGRYSILDIAKVTIE